MSNEVNISEVAVGTLDPHYPVEIYHWGVQPQKARFFTLTVYPTWFALVGAPYDMEITRVWSTTWVGEPPEFVRTHQWNVRITNGDQGAEYHLLMAETDN